MDIETRTNVKFHLHTINHTCQLQRLTEKWKVTWKNTYLDWGTSASIVRCEKVSVKFNQRVYQIHFQSCQYSTDLKKIEFHIFAGMFNGR